MSAKTAKSAIILERTSTFFLVASPDASIGIPTLHRDCLRNIICIANVKKSVKPPAIHKRNKK